MRANFPYFGHFSERLFLLRAKTSHIFLSTRGGRKAKKNEREYFGLFLFGLNSSAVHPPLLPCACFLDAKVAEVQCLPAILTLRQTAGFPRPMNECWPCGVEASARVMRSTWPADVIGGFRDTGVKGWHGAL